MSTIFTPPSIPAGSTVVGSPFSPGGIPGTGGGASGLLPSAGAITPLGDLNTLAGSMAALDLSTGSAVWPGVNAVIVLPFSLPYAATFSRVSWFNGAAVSGNLDVGIYNEDGTKIVTNGSVAQAGISTIQVVNLTSTPLAAGSYLFAMVFDNTTAQMTRWTTSNGTTFAALGVMAATNAFPLPATLAGIGGSGTSVPNYIPIVSLATVSVS